MIGPSKQNVHEPSAFCLSLNSAMVFFDNASLSPEVCPSRSTPSEAYIFSVIYRHYRKKNCWQAQFFNMHVNLRD